MDKNNLPISNKKREIPVIIPEVIENRRISSINEANKSVIKFKGGSEIVLTPEHVGSIIQIGAKVVEGFFEIIKVREVGKQKVEEIAMEIKKIYAEADAEVKKINAETDSFNTKFENKKEMIFSVIQKIESNQNWSEEIKLALIECTAKALQ